MMSTPRSWRRFPRRWLTTLAVPALLSVTGGGWSAELLPAPPPVLAAPASAALDIAACRQIAQEHQPSIVAARASLCAANARANALNNIRFGALLSRDLPVRKQQACAGIQGYEAALHQAEADARYAVTYSYLAVLYAQEQEEVLRQARVNLDKLGDQIKEFVENKQNARHIKAQHLNLIESYRATIEGRREEAVQGRERALASLREAMGVGADFALALSDTRLPNPVYTPPASKEEIVTAAQSRRGEVVQTETTVRISCLEVTAQGKSFLPTLRTFAAGGDLHAMPIPYGSKGLDYKPGALAPEMPVSLAGHRRDRIGQATIYYGRAESVAEKTRNLVGLEAEDAFFRWKEEMVKQDRLRKAAVEAQKFSEWANKQFRDAAQDGFKYDPAKMEPPPTRVEDVIAAGNNTIRMKVDANEARFDYLLSLALLERVTAGCFVVEFVPAPPPPPPGNGNGGR